MQDRPDPGPEDRQGERRLASRRLPGTPAAHDRAGERRMTPLERRLAHHAKTRYLVYVRIGGPARKHHIDDLDILQAARHAIREVPNDDDDVMMLIGPARNGALLEIGILGAETDDPVIIHAMPMRPKYQAFLG